MEFLPFSTLEFFFGFIFYPELFETKRVPLAQRQHIEENRRITGFDSGLLFCLCCNPSSTKWVQSVPVVTSSIHAYSQVFTILENLTKTHQDTPRSYKYSKATTSSPTRSPLHCNTFKTQTPSDLHAWLSQCIFGCIRCYKASFLHFSTALICIWLSLHFA